MGVRGGGKDKGDRRRKRKEGASRRQKIVKGRGIRRLYEAGGVWKAPE